MQFQVMAVVTAAVALVLGLAWLAAGGKMLERWSVAADPTALLVGRRIGVVYVMFALLMLSVRSAPAGHMRIAMAASAAAGLVLLASLGAWELRAKRVGRGILVAVVLEYLLAAGFASSVLAA